MLRRGTATKLNLVINYHQSSLEKKNHKKGHSQHIWRGKIC